MVSKIIKWVKDFERRRPAAAFGFALATCCAAIAYPLWDFAGSFWTAVVGLSSRAVEWIVANAGRLIGLLLTGLGLMGFSWLSASLIRRFRKTEAVVAPSKAALLPDAPIDLEQDDQFRYGEFSDRLVEFLCLSPTSPSLVLALDDKWGSGKTSVLNLLRQRLLQRSPQPLVIDFSPWAIGSHTSLIQFFLIQLAAEVEEKITDRDPITVAAVTRDLVAMASHVPLVLGAPSAELWSQSIEKLLRERGSESSSLVETVLSSHKAKVERQLSSLARPIVVFIDDIDRLRADDVFALMQLVRAVCDFRGVCYLLALDMARTAQVMFPAQPSEGMAYLEKILQVTVALPPVALSARKAHLANKIKEACAQNGITLSAAETQMLEDAKSILAGLLQTPRDVVRFLNRILVGFHSANIFFPDRLVFEALGLKAPTVTSYVRRFTQRFAKIGAGEDEEADPAWSLWTSSKEEVEKRRNDLLSELLEPVASEIRPFVKPALEFLFPRQFAKEWTWPDLKPEQHDRIEYHPALIRLINAMSSGVTHSASDARLFLSNPKDRPAVLQSLVADAKNTEFLGFLRSFLVSDVTIEPLQATDVLMEFAAREWETRQREIADDIAEVILSLLAGPIPDARKAEVLTRLASVPTCISVSERVVVSLARKGHLWIEGQFHKGASFAEVSALRAFGISVSQLYEVVSLWVATVRSAAQRHNFLITEQNPISIFFRWGQFESYAEPAEYLKRLFQIEDNVGRFIAAFEGSSANGTEQLIEDKIGFLQKLKAFEKSQPQAFKKFSDYLSGFVGQPKPT